MESTMARDYGSGSGGWVSTTVVHRQDVGRKENDKNDDADDDEHNHH